MYHSILIANLTSSRPRVALCRETERKRVSACGVSNVWIHPKQLKLSLDGSWKLFKASFSNSAFEQRSLQLRY